MLIDKLKNEIFVLTEYSFNDYIKNYFLDRLDLIEKLDKGLYAWALNVLERLEKEAF